MKKTKAKDRTFQKGSWTARKRGNIYCAPACGRGCTYAEYLLAKERARTLVMVMGSGWNSRVHENLGWHYSVTSPSGHLMISPSHYNNEVSYWASLRALGQQWTSDHTNDPRKAMRQVLRKARIDLDSITAMLKHFK